MAATLIGLTGSALGDEPLGAFPALSMWDGSYSVRSGGGFKDNVFLSHAAPVQSPFLSTGGDVVVFRVGAFGPEFSFFGSGDLNHYLDRTHREGTALGQAKLEQDFGATCKGSLAAEYFFQHQVTDLSVSETNRQAVAAVGHTFSLRPGARMDLPRQFWFSVEAAGTRQLFEKPLDDYWEAAPRLTLGHTYGHGSYLAASYETVWRFYDREFSRTRAGQTITNELRHAVQPEARLAWRHFWDEPGRWRTTLALAGRYHEENGGGFFDYTRPLASAELRYRAPAWEISIEGRAAEYHYRAQTVSATDSSKRRRTDWSAALHLERRLTKHFRLLASYEHEQTSSNDPLETYSVNTVSGSVQWEF